MDRDRLAQLSRLVATAGSRRQALRLLLGGAVVGAASGLDGATARRGKRARQGNRGTLRTQQDASLCPSTCTRNCDDKPIQGGAILTRCNLSGRDLDGVDLGGSNVSKACFEDASLRNVNFGGANVSGTCFCNADLRGATFGGTRITAAQLACAKPGCDTILPNGQPAVRCGRGERCCDGICVRTGNDPDNCGACGVACGPCQSCANGRCGDLADGQFDCSRQPLNQVGDSVCTAGPNTGICAGGVCNCGDGEYDAAANACRCGPVESDDCTAAGQCCEVSTTCLSGGSFVALADCVACGGGGGQTRLRCGYKRQGTGPNTFVCIPNAGPYVIQCAESFEGRHCNGANVVASCSACGAT